MSLRAWPRTPKRWGWNSAPPLWAKLEHKRGTNSANTDPEGEPSPAWLPQDNSSPSAHTNCSFLHALHSSREQPDKEGSDPVTPLTKLLPSATSWHLTSTTGSIWWRKYKDKNRDKSKEKTFRVSRQKAVTVTQRTIAYIQIKQYQLLTLSLNICIWMICYENTTLEASGDGYGETQVWKSHQLWLCTVFSSTKTENWLEPSNQNRIPIALIIISQ